MPLSNDVAGTRRDRSPAPSPAAPLPVGPSDVPSRQTLIAELVEEMTSWKPRERMHSFRLWLKGSLSLIHLHVLTVLEADGPVAMSRLADTLDVSVASATGIIGRMEERGLVERHHDELDRRVVVVHPTAAGVAVFRDMAAERRQHLSDLLDRLADDELAALLTGLRAIRVARAAHAAERGVVADMSEGARPETAATSEDASPETAATSAQAGSRS